MKAELVEQGASVLVDLGDARQSGLHEEDLAPVPRGRATRQTTVYNVWLEMPLDEHWMVAHRLVPQAGQPVVAEVRVFPREASRSKRGEWSARLLGVRALVPAGGLTARLHRRVKLGAHLVEGVKVMAWVAEEADRRRQAAHGTRRRVGPAPFDADGWLGRLGFAAPPERRPIRRSGKSPGRPGRPPAAVARVARDYADAVNRKSRRPVADVAARRQLKSHTVRDMVRRARVLGLLSPAVPGRAGGQLTPRGRALLKKR